MLCCHVIVKKYTKCCVATCQKTSLYFAKKVKLEAVDPVDDCEQHHQAETSFFFLNNFFSPKKNLSIHLLLLYIIYSMACFCI